MKHWQREMEILFIFSILLICFKDKGAKLPIREHEQLSQRLLLLMFRKEKRKYCFLSFEIFKKRLSQIVFRR